MSDEEWVGVDCILYEMFDVKKKRKTIKAVLSTATMISCKPEL